MGVIHKFKLKFRKYNTAPAGAASQAAVVVVVVAAVADGDYYVSVFIIVFIMI